MKRVLPLLLLLSITEVYFIVVFWNHLFHTRYVNVSEVEIISDSQCKNPDYYRIQFIFNDKLNVSIMDKDDYDNVYKKNHTIKYSIYDKYRFLSFLYAVFSIMFVIYLIMKLLDCVIIYKPDWRLGNRFCVSEALFWLYAVVYNQIDSYDLTRISKFIIQFFGYKYE